MWVSYYQSKKGNVELWAWVTASLDDLDGTNIVFSRAMACLARSGSDLKKKYSMLHEYRKAPYLQEAMAELAHWNT